MKHRGKLCAVGLAACLTISGCGLLPEEEVYRSATEFTNYEADDYSYVTVAQGDLANLYNFTVRFVPTESADLSFGVSNREFVGIYVTAGQTVKKGDLLAELYCDDIVAQLAVYEEEKGELEYRKDYYEKILDIEARKRQLLYNESYEDAYRTLYNDPTCEASTELYNIEGSLKLLEMKLELYYAEKAQRQIYATMDGTVSYVKKINLESKSKAGERLITIIDDSLIFQGDTKQYEYFEVGQKHLIDVSGVKYDATVTAIEDSKLNYKTISLELSDTTAAFAQSTRGIISIVKDSRENVLYIPLSVVVTIDDKAAVYVLDDDGVRRIRYITPGFETNTHVEVIEGLAFGEAVINSK